MRFFGYLRYFFALKRPTSISPLAFSLYFLSTLHCSYIITALKVSPHPSFRVTHPSFALASHAAFAHSCRLLQTLLLFRPHLSLQMTLLPNALKIQFASMISLHMCPSSFSFIPVSEDELGPKASSAPWTSDFHLLSSSGPSSINPLISECLSPLCCCFWLTEVSAIKYEVLCHMPGIVSGTQNTGQVNPYLHPSCDSLE